uniref:PDZ domain-containing protein n=1 Tax=Sander lucioperca TaxID=283035 RepID=A0A8D0A465_SANLU
MLSKRGNSCHHWHSVYISNTVLSFPEPFMSLLLVLSHMEFKLDMENCSFLDESWLLPVCERYEVVPCREVGMVLRYLSGRVFVLELMPGSQAHVDKFISPGDIIDEINGTSLRNSKNGQAGVVLSRLKGCPLSIGVLRWRAQDGTVYLPLIKLLQALRMEDPTLQLGPAPSQQSATKDQRNSPSQCLKEGRIVYIVQFLGKANIMFGGKEVLQHAITQVLQKNLPSKEVLLDMKETHLTCTERNSKSELFEHHYPEISCVGRFSQGDYTIFAFCVVDSPETPQSTGFCCVALRASTIKECEVIVCRIATGFKHTEWFV